MRYCLIAFVMLLTGCSTSPVQRNRLLLPVLDVENLVCCWQSQELLGIELQGHQFELSSAIALADGRLVVVILDPLGQRLLTVNQRGIDVSIDTSREIPDKFPVDWLLLGVYLRYMPMSAWLFEGSEWQVYESDGSRLLTWQGKPMIRMRSNSASQQSEDIDVSELYFSSLDMKVTVKVLSRLPL